MTDALVYVGIRAAAIASVDRSITRISLARVGKFSLHTNGNVKAAIHD
ncbi:hypothetical protein [Stenomitos frigidus]|nr:hypothetical protein [Stenomitos frigidus]